MDIKTQIAEFQRKQAELTEALRFLMEKRKMYDEEINSLIESKHIMQDPVGNIKCYEYLMNNELRKKLSFIEECAGIIMDYVNDRCVYVINGCVTDEDIKLLTSKFKYKLRIEYAEDDSINCEEPCYNCGTEWNRWYSSEPCHKCKKNLFWLRMRRDILHLQTFEDYDEGVDLYFPSAPYGGIVWGEEKTHRLLNSKNDDDNDDIGYNCKQRNKCNCSAEDIPFDWEDEYVPMIYKLVPVYSVDIE